MTAKLWTIGLVFGFLAFLAWIGVAATLGLSEPLLVLFVLFVVASISAFVGAGVSFFARRRRRA